MASIKVQSLEVVIPNGTALSAAFNMDQFSKGILHLPAAWTAADIGFYVSASLSGTYTPLSDASGIVVISGPAVSSSYVFPTNMVGARFVKLWSNTAGVDTNQGAARTIGIDLKT